MPKNDFKIFQEGISVMDTDSQATLPDSQITLPDSQVTLPDSQVTLPDSQPDVIHCSICGTGTVTPIFCLCGQVAYCGSDCLLETVDATNVHVCPKNKPEKSPYDNFYSDSFYGY